MRKVFRLDGDLCANCAAKIQSAVEKLPGVHAASVNAMTLKFMLDAEDAAFDDVFARVQKIFNDIEPDCEVLV